MKLTLEQKIEEIQKNFNSQIENLRNEIKKANKPKIEVGKVYKENRESKLLLCITEVNGDRIRSFGFTRNGEFKTGFLRYASEEWTEATKEEWELALTNYFDKLYDGVEKVDRSGLDLPKINGTITTFGTTSSTYWKDEGQFFCYKGRNVMDKHGKWATPVIEEKEIEHDFEVKGIGSYKFNFEGKSFEKGFYKLVKVD